jgi:hypothetical protein
MADGEVPCCRVRCRSPKKSVEEPEDEGQADTEEEGGHQRCVELQAWPFDADIARQAPHPAELVGNEPQYQTHDDQERAKAHKDFTEILHGQALTGLKIDVLRIA